jgi:DNA-binding NarL/FixJ family response regulator
MNSITKQISLAIVEDVDEIRIGLKEYFSVQPEFMAIEVFSNMEDILAKLQSGFSPDVILSDIGLPGINGIEGIKRITAINSEVDIIMLTVFMDGDKIFNALCAGATGYLLKGTPMPEIQKAIVEIHNGGSYMSPTIARKVVEHFKTPTQKINEQLTSKEKDVINCLLDGLSYKLIADRLAIPIDTVRFRIKSIYKKLHVNSKAEILSKALKGEI